MSFDEARRIADAVLYEGYVLYPYRASATKNRVRWQFGIVAPRGYGEAGGTEPSVVQTECLVEGLSPHLDLRLRFLQVQSRTIEEAEDALDGPSFRRVESMVVDGAELVTWDEGVEQARDYADLALPDLVDRERSFRLAVVGVRETEPVRSAAGRIRGRVVRERWPTTALVRIGVEETSGLWKLRIRVDNVASWPEGAGADRDLALRHSLVGLHMFLGVRGGAFLSLLDPPPGLEQAAAACRNEHTWPVLVGPEGDRSVMLSSPIILYDHPAVAPESPGDLCDATEIDEILLLRVLTLTDEEKREARATDARARRIVDRSESIPPEVFERLHGVVRGLKPVPRAGPSVPDATWEAFLNPPGVAAPPDATLEIGSALVARGSRVRLDPRRRADSMDFFLAGRTARVEGVFRDVDDQAYVAVTLEDDPAADLQGAAGRYYYFHPEEIEPLDTLAAGASTARG